MPCRIRIQTPIRVTPSGTAKHYHFNQMVPYCVTVTGFTVSGEVLQKVYFTLYVGVFVCSW